MHPFILVIHFYIQVNQFILILTYVYLYVFESIIFIWLLVHWFILMPSTSESCISSSPLYGLSCGCLLLCYFLQRFDFHLIILSFIVQHGGHVNAVDHTGQTALHWSAVRGSIQVAELLLNYGAKIDAVDSYGYQVCLIVYPYYHIINPS